MRLIVVLSVLLLAACGEPGGGDSATPRQDALDSDRPVDELVVEQRLDETATPQRWTLTCAGTVRGDHPAGEAACRHLATLDAPFAPVPDDAMCTEIYGGPQTARVTGHWHGEPVDLALSRVDGCRIAQWDSLGPLLPGPVGVDPPPTGAPR